MKQTARGILMNASVDGHETLNVPLQELYDAASTYAAADGEEYWTARRKLVKAAYDLALHAQATAAAIRKQQAMKRASKETT